VPKPAVDRLVSRHTASIKMPGIIGTVDVDITEAAVLL
jgi:hypothetical protein